MNRNLLITFSGGETSALMTKILVDKYSDKFNLKIVFANTGRENDQTLDFVKKCQDYFGWEVVWLEAVVHHGKRKSCSHNIVDFESACRDGSVFEEMIKKYGIPNKAYPHCTRELKLNPINSYIKSIGWDKQGFKRAIGIRVDELNRVDESANEKGVIYPLAHIWPMTKPDVNKFWRDMPFRLELTGYQGNCKTCWKKSTRKLLTIMSESPESFDFDENMESEYAMVGAYPGTGDKKPRRWYRGNLTVNDLRELCKNDDWSLAENDAVIYKNKSVHLDMDFGCVESCEVEF